MVLEDIHNLHANKLCFIAGSSPSLRHINYETIKPYVVITVNSAILKYPNCNYFVTDDQGVHTWNYWYDTARNSKCIKLLFKDKLDKHVDGFNHDEIIFYQHRFYKQYSDNQAEYDRQTLRMFADPKTPIIGARSSLASAINLAVIMGCDPIVTIGMDNSYEGNKRYYWQFDGEKKATEINNRIFSVPNKGKINNLPIDNHCFDYMEYWQRFAAVNSDFLRGRIINASVNSLIEIFPKRDLHSILQEHGGRYV